MKVCQNYSITIARRTTVLFKKRLRLRNQCLPFARFLQFTSLLQGLHFLQHKQCNSHFLFIYVWYVHIIFYVFICIFINKCIYIYIYIYILYIYYTYIYVYIYIYIYNLRVMSYILIIININFLITYYSPKYYLLIELLFSSD